MTGRGAAAIGGRRGVDWPFRFRRPRRSRRI